MTSSTGSEYVKSSTDGDLLPVVDEHDRVVGSATRREVHARNLLHRAVHVVVVNDRGEVLLQHRSAQKDRFPGWWDISIGGHVDAGEEYDDAARRELLEEMGIRAPFEEIARRPATEATGWEFVRLYECRYYGPPRPDPHEVDAFQWIAPEELFANAHCDPARDDGLCVTDSGLDSLRLWGRLRGFLPGEDVPC